MIGPRKISARGEVVTSSKQLSTIAPSLHCKPVE